MRARRLTLMVAGLQPPPRAHDDLALALEGVNLPLLRQIRARARRDRRLERGLEATLYALFNYRGHPPVAALTRLSDTGVRDTGFWLRADPVHLQPNRGGLILLDNETVALSAIEAQALIAEILTVFAADGWRLEAPVPNRWYVQPPKAPAVEFIDLPSAAGRDVNTLLPRGPDAPYWHRSLNEIQMLLSRTATNDARELRGDLTINSVWFWGGGPLPSSQRAAWTQLWTREAFSHGLALLAGTPVAPSPMGADDWLGAAGDGMHLLVLDSGRGARQYGDIDGWREWLIQLETAWLKPLVAAIRAADLAEFTMIDSSSGAMWSVDRRDLRRWWCRPAPLNQCFLLDEDV